MSDNVNEKQNAILLVPDSVEDTEAQDPEAQDTEVVSSPAKVLRIGTMIKTLLDEARQAPLDESSRARLKEIYETSRTELKTALSDDLSDELDRISLTFLEGEIPSEGELRLAQAQLVGWLEGLFHGFQAAVFAQQLQNRSQMEDPRRRGLPQGSDDGHRPGTYL